MAKPITIKITGDTKGLQGALGQAEGMLGRFGNKAALAAVGAATAAIGAAGAIALEVGKTIEVMEDTIIKGTGATGEALDGLIDSARDVMAQVPDSGEMVATVLADVNTFFGATGDELEDLTEGFLDFARLTGVEASTAVGNMDAIFTQFGLGTDQMDEALGDFIRIAQASGAPMDQLLGQMETFGPLFANAGFSAEETAAIFGQLEQAGVNLTRVGPALNKFFREAASNGEDPREALEAMVEQIANAESSTEALSLASAAFGAEGAQRMTSAIRSGNFDLEDFNGLLGDGAGILAEQTAATQTFGDRWNELKNKVFVALMPAIEKLMDLIIEGIESIGPMVEKFVGWWEEDIGPVVSDVMEDIQAVFDTILPILQGAWELFGDEILDYAENTFNTIKTVIESVLRIIKGIWNTFVGVFTGDWGRAWDGIKDVFGGVWDGIKGILSGALENIKILFRVAWDLVKLSVTNALDGIVGAISGMGSRIRSAASGMWNGIKDAFKAAINWIIDGWNGLEFTLPSVNTRIPGVGRIGGWTLGTPNIPRLAMGGTMARDGFAVVGERGPELVRLPRGATVEPNHAGPALAGASVTVNAQTNADPVRIAEEVAWVLRTTGG